jgi:S1-C subfamily serine protease
MKRILGFLVLISFLIFGCNRPQMESLSIGESMEFITASKQQQFYKAVQSTVKILALSLEGGASGTGTYFNYKGQTFVITAAHVLEDSVLVIAERGDEKVNLLPVWVDDVNDVAILIPLQEMTRIRPHKLSLAKHLDLGEELFYAGFPGGLGPLFLKGSVSAVSLPDLVIMQSYGWGGASGSAVYNSSGNLIGIVVGINVNDSRTVGKIEDPNLVMVYVFSNDTYLILDTIIDLLK